MIRRPPRSTLDRSSAASDVYKRQEVERNRERLEKQQDKFEKEQQAQQKQKDKINDAEDDLAKAKDLSLIHISEPTRPY